MRTFLITGTSTGIGHAMALYFARLGDRVYATMRDPAASGAVLTDVALDEDLEIRVLALDVSDAASVEAAVAEVIRESGQVDVLVNNAGVARLGSVEESPIAWLESTLDTNVTGAARVVQAVLPSMRAQRSGTIVNVSSVSGRLASSITGYYCASKAAVEALSEALAAEVLQFGVRVIVLQPGFVTTPILDKALAVPDGSEDGPYGPLVRAKIAFFQEGKAAGDEPVEVAKALDRALQDPHPRLRYPASSSAESALAYRNELSDEEWIQVNAEVPE